MKSSSSNTGRSIKDLLGSKNGLRPLHEWFIYVGILTLLLSIIVGPLLVNAIKSDSSGICVIIVIIFLGAIIKNFWDTYYLDRQIRLSREQITQLGEVKNILHFLKSTEESVLREHVSNLFTIFRMDILIQQDNLISLLQMKLLSRTKIIGFCSNILVTLGLVGTIMGLIFSTSGLGSVMESVGEDNNSLLAGMQETVNGMGTAFYTTLLGAILGGVFLRLLSNLSDSYVDLLVASVAEISEVYVLPILRRASRVKDKENQAKLIARLKQKKNSLDKIITDETDILE